MRARSRGMTLVEVSLVIVIVSILAVLALVGYRRYRAAARLSEATGMMAAIQAAQDEFKSERGVYANISQDLDSLYPNANPTNRATQWGGPCKNCAGNDERAWQKLKINPPGPVMFGYATTAGIGGQSTVSPPHSLADRSHALIGNALSDMPNKIGATEPFYVSIAVGDTDANGVRCAVMGSSHTNQLVVTNEGE
jgi:type IV pilus assembly protein PilA